MLHKQKKALIIRSASFQQLDQNLPELQLQMPDYSFDLLTHEHGVKLAQKYEGIAQVIAYPYKDSFSNRLKVGSLKDKHYDVVIVLVTNVTGVGFWNVIQFAYTISADKYLQCNMHSELKVLTKLGVLKGSAVRVLQKMMSVVATAAVALFAIPFLLWGIMKIRTK